MTDIRKLGVKDVVRSRLIAFLDGTLQLFWQQIAVRVLHQCMGFTPQHPGSSKNVKTSVENFVATLASLDAFFTTALVCLQKTVLIQLAFITKNWTTKRSNRI